MPIIPAIVASGLLMGLLEGLSKVYPDLAGSSVYTILLLFSNAAFTFLPILVAISSAKAFGGNIFLGAVIGMIMIHPSLLNAWDVASAADIPTVSVWFGLYDIRLVGYQGHVIPIVMSVWLMSKLEIWLHKVVPEIIDLFVTPLVSVLISGYLALTVIGPVFSYLENAVLYGIQYVIAIPFGIGAAIAGGIYAPTVVAGIHHMYNAIEAGMLSKNGMNTWMPIATAANVAQGAAALAVAFKTKDKKIRALAFPSSLSAFLGITEPVIFGVNIRFLRPFVAGIIGGAAGALVAGFFKVYATAYGVTGIFGLLITTENIWTYLLVMAVAFVVAFVISYIIFIDNRVNSYDGSTNQLGTHGITAKAGNGDSKSGSGSGSDSSRGSSSGRGIGSNSNSQTANSEVKNHIINKSNTRLEKRDTTSTNHIENSNIRTKSQKNISDKNSITKNEAIINNKDEDYDSIKIKSLGVGKKIKLENVRDESFKNEVLGTTFAFSPTEGNIISPVDGEVTTVTESGHAIGIVSEDGVELLIHVGIDTVKLGREYFTPLVKVGDVVDIGQPILDFNISGVRGKGYDPTTFLVLTNSYEYSQIDIYDKEKINRGDTIMEVIY